ncbi:MAG: cadherin-like beta sandwich domain-containing protein [Thiotrichales bacterium]
MIRILTLVILALALNACGNSGFSPQSSAELTFLESSSGTLNPGFSTARLNYSLTIDPSIESVRIKAVSLHDGATILINGKKTLSGQNSAPIATTETPTTVAIRVTSPDESRTNNYRITIIVPGQEALIPDEVSNPPAQTNETDEPAPEVPELASLSITTPNATQQLQINGDEFITQVDQSVDAVSITAVSGNSSDIIAINSQTASPGEATTVIPLSVGSNTIPLTVTSPNGELHQYTLTVERAAAFDFGLEETIGSPNPQRNSGFGFSNAVSGSWLAISAPTMNAAYRNQGEVYLYQKTNNQWKYQQALQSPASARNDQFGYSLAMDGDYLAVSSYGAETGEDNSGRVDIFKQAGGQWKHHQLLQPPAALENGRFGFSLAMDGSVLAIAELNGIDGSLTGGGVTVYEREDVQWTLKKSIFSRGASDRFASNIAISGDLLAIGAFDYDGECKIAIPDPGEVSIYERKNGDWIEQSTLYASNGDGGDRFGFSVSLSNDFLAVSAICEDSSRFNPQANDATQAGSVYLFKRNGNQWTEITQLKASDAEAHDLFGSRLQLMGENLIVTAPLEDTQARDAGAAYQFSAANNWAEKRLIRAIDGKSGDKFGAGLAFDGSTAVISATQQSEGNRERLGKTYLFH